MTFALEVTALRKTYQGLLGRRGHEALRGIDLAVEEGAAFGLIGPNGAGKTTFIKALLGIVRPTDGAVKVLGGVPEDPRIRARIGYLPERLHLPGSFTPRQFLKSVARLKGLANPDPEVLRLLDRVGLGPDGTRRIGGFSKGMRQRLGLAAALLGRPSLLILDEPTDGVDPIGRADVRGILTEELARGATLFLNSHLLAETERVCGRIGVLAQGRIAREGRLDELTRASSRWLLRFAAGSVGDAVALGKAGLGATLDPLVFSCDVEGAAALNAAIDQARRSGALLVELSRESKDLEDVLRDALGAAA